MAGASRIIGVDLNPARFDRGESLMLYINICSYLHVGDGFDF